MDARIPLEPMGKPPRWEVLVVDDQESVRVAVERRLEADGFAVRSAATGGAALAILADAPPDLVVLDIGLPDIDGLEVLRTIRRATDLPVILLTARDDELDRVLGLELGADDYVPKPFSARELSARIRSVLRRAGRRPAGGDATGTPADAPPGAAVSPADAVTPAGAGTGAAARTPPATGPGRAPSASDTERRTFGDLVVDTATREVWRHGRRVATTRREFDLLAVLVKAPLRVFSREQLLREAWDSSSDWQDASTVTEHVRRLRNKLEDDPRNPTLIEAVYGVGYRFVPPGG